jgi:hypothetical protein
VCGSDKAWQVVDVVRAISIHLTDEIGVLLECVPHAVDVRAPEPLLALPVDDVHPAFMLPTQ